MLTYYSIMLLYYTLWDSWQLPLEQHCCHILVRLGLLCSHIQGCKCIPASNYQWRPKSNTEKEIIISWNDIDILTLSGLVFINSLNCFTTKKRYSKKYISWNFISGVKQKLHSAINSFCFLKFLGLFYTILRPKSTMKSVLRATIFY